MPFSEYFTRSAFAKRWHAIPFEEKEAVAADMRRNLTRIRNQAARADPAPAHPGNPQSAPPRGACSSTACVALP
jgi:hypothetical protein